MSWGTAAQRIIVNTEHSLMYCPIPLVGNGPFLKLLYALEHQKGAGIGHVPSAAIFNMSNYARLSDYSLREQRALLATSCKFMVVRHPLTRLAAVYKQKFEANNAYFHKRYGREIVSRHRPGSRGTTRGDDVTFAEFVESIGSREILNEHWASQEELCLPCTLQYDLVLHYEKLADESLKLLQQLQLLDAARAFPLSWNSVSRHDLHRLWESVSPSSIGRVVQLYRRDFLLFGYPAVV